MTLRGQLPITSTIQFPSLLAHAKSSQKINVHAVSKLACLVLSSARSCRSSICPGRLSTVWLVPLSSLLVLWSPSGDTRGPSVVLEAVDIPCPGPFHADYINDLCPLPDPDVAISILVCCVAHIYFHFGCAAESLWCANLVSVQVSAPYVIVGSTWELYAYLFRQMARLLLKTSRCLAYAAQPTMILR